MKKYYFNKLFISLLTIFITFVSQTVLYAKETAKSSFEGKKGVGISYKIILVSKDGQTKVVPTSHVFKIGDKIKLLIKTNKSGYLTILNIGSSGNTHILFNEYVEADKEIEIPTKSNLRFVGEPGVEKILVMLSMNPNPLLKPQNTGGKETSTISSKTPPTQSAQPNPPNQPSTPTPSTNRDIDELTTPLPLILASLEGAKDIVLEDDLKTSYAVISTQDNFNPQKVSSTEIKVESKDGSHYGVVPASVLNKGILTLEIKLKHK